MQQRLRVPASNSLGAQIDMRTGSKAHVLSYIQSFFGASTSAPLTKHKLREQFTSPRARTVMIGRLIAGRRVPGRSILVHSFHNPNPADTGAATLLPASSEWHEP
jgi:hypothetical protein